MYLCVCVCLFLHVFTYVWVCVCIRMECFSLSIRMECMYYLKCNGIGWLEVNVCVFLVWLIICSRSSISRGRYSQSEIEKVQIKRVLFVCCHQHFCPRSTKFLNTFLNAHIQKSFVFSVASVYSCSIYKITLVIIFQNKK